MKSNYLNVVLTVIAVLLGLNLWVGLHQSPASALLDPATPAHAAGSVSAGQQRANMIKSLEKIQSSVDAVSSKLTDGSMKVTVTSMPDHD